MRPASAMVREFHETYGIPVLDSPAFPSHDRCALRERILEEEWTELCEAQAKRDIVEVADALADMLYIIHGTALEYGIPLDAVVAEVHRSNMSKLGADGKPVRREDGKILKGPNYSPPDIRSILAETESTVRKLAKMRAAVRSAPHDRQCALNWGRMPDDASDGCNCWKSRLPE